MSGIMEIFKPPFNVGGRKHPTVEMIARAVRMSDYMMKDIVTPTSCDFRAKATPVLRDIFGNDTRGDCVIAGGYHLEGVWTGNAGDLFHATLSQVFGDYGKIGGYDPSQDQPDGSNPTDNGCDEITALNYWQQTGFVNGHKLLGWTTVDSANVSQVKGCQFLFENLFFGISLPDEWISPFPSADGLVWDVAGDPNPRNGHCVVGAGYTDQGVIICTWGLFGVITWAAIAKYCSQASQGALYTMLSPDQLVKGMLKAPNGVAWTDLVKDFDSYGGKVVIPASSGSILALGDLDQRISVLEGKFKAVQGVLAA